jgi:hypothetical protein
LAAKGLQQAADSRGELVPFDRALAGQERADRRQRLLARLVQQGEQELAAVLEVGVERRSRAPCPLGDAMDVQLRERGTLDEQRLGGT